MWKEYLLGSAHEHSSSSPELEVVPDVDLHEGPNTILEPALEHTVSLKLNTVTH